MEEEEQKPDTTAKDGDSVATTREPTRRPYTQADYERDLRENPLPEWHTVDE